MSQASFDSFYEKELVPYLEELEAERQVVVRKVRKMLMIILPIVGVAVLCFFLLHGVAQEVSMWVGGISILLAIIIGAIMYSGYISEYKIKYKQQIIRRIVKHIGEDLEYQPKGFVSRAEYMSSKIFLQGVDRYKGEDLIHGNIGKTEIKFSELHSEYKTESRDSKGRRQTHWHTIFKGVFFIADFHKDFATETVVLPDTMEKTFGWLGKKLQKMNFSRPDLISLEDPEFEKYFVVYGQDQVEARYILSTKLMRRIIRYRSKWGRNIYLSFVNSKVFVALPHHKDLFEPRIFKPIKDKLFIKETADYLKLFTDIVHDLDLNTRIWTKR